MAAAAPTAIHATTIDDFDVGQVIGRGGFGLVYRARHRATGKEVALKVLDKRALHAEGMAPRVVNEVRLHARAASVQPQAQQKEQQPHRHIVALLGFFEDDRSVYLILEHCPSGDLYRYLKRHGPLAPEAAAAVIAQVLAALVHLHEANGIVHRDLKLSNLLLLPCPPSSPPPSSSPFPYTVKLADFGLAARLEGPLGGDAERFTVCGTPEYIAPEVAGQRHGRPVDLWSAGCLLYSLLTGRAPFPRSSACGSDNGGSGNGGSSGSGSGFVPPSPHTVWKGGYEPPAGLSAAGRDFLRRLLEPDPGRRPTARAMLAHPFLTGEHMAEEEEEEDTEQHSFVGGHGASHLLDDSSILTVVPSERRGGSSSLQGWSSSASVATRAPSLSSPPPPPPSTRQRPRRRRSSSSSKAPPEKKQQQALTQMKQTPPAPGAPAAMTLTIPPAAHGDDAELPPPPHHRLHPRRSRTARAKAAQQMEMEQQQRRQQQGATTVSSSLSAPPPPPPFFLLQHPVSAAAATTADPGTNKAPNNLPPLVPIDAARLPPGRFLLPHPSGQHEGLLRLKRDGRVSLMVRSLKQQDVDGWRWSLRIRPGGLRVRVAVAAANPGYRSEEEYTLGDLPLAYHAAYRYCWRLVQGVRAMTPKMTLFLVRRHEQPQSQQQQPPQVLAKCMVMENGPLPDFKVRWADGAVLRYSLRTGQLTLALGEAPASPLFESPATLPQEAQRPGLQRRRRHACVIGGLGMECAATGEAGKYLGQAQWAMRRCLQAEEALLATGMGKRAAATTFPVVLYDEVDEDGEREQEASAVAPVAAAPSPEEECRSWPLVAALRGVGQARRSPRGDVAVALEGEGTGVVLILSPDATRLTALPDGAQYALPALTHLKTGARMPKSLRAQVRLLHRVLRAVGEGQNGV